MKSNIFTLDDGVDSFWKKTCNILETSSVPPAMANTNASAYKNINNFVIIETSYHPVSSNADINGCFKVTN